MSRDRVRDAERLAALLDGRLTGAERDALIAELAADEELASIYGDAIAASTSIESETSRQDVERPVAGSRAPRLRPAWLLAAASVVIVAGVALVWSRARSGPDSVGTFIASLSSSDAGLPPAVMNRPWSALRGAGPAFSPSARAARTGALLADLDVALRARDTVAAAISREIASLIADLPASGPAVILYDQLAARGADGSAATLALSGRARNAVTGLLDRSVVDVGAFVETSRIAALRQDAGYFADSARTAAGTMAIQRASLDAPVRDSLLQGIQQVRLLNDWSERSARLAALLGTIAR